MGNPADDIAARAAAEALVTGQPLTDHLATEVVLPAPPPSGAPAVPNLRKAAMTGALWMGVGYGGIKILNFANGIIQSYYVNPIVAGVMATVGAFLVGLHMFSDVGIGMSVVQNKRGDDPEFLNTAWTLQVLRGLLLWVATWLIAWPVALFWDDPNLHQPSLMILIPLCGATAFIDGLNSTALFSLQRNLQRGRLVALEMTVQTIGMALTLFWIVCVSPDVWAFVIGQLGTSLLNMTLTHLALPGPRSRFRWDPTAVHELLHFGKWIFLSTAITFFAFQADPLIWSKVAGAEWLGVLGRALTLAAIATELMSKFASDLVFPVYSRMHREGRDIRSNFQKVHLGAASFAALLVCGLLASGPALCRGAYGPAYEAAAWMLPFVAVAAWFKMLEGTTGASLMTLGQTRSVMFSNATRVIGLLVCLPLGYVVGRLAGLGGSSDPLDGGFRGLLLGFIGADFIRYLMVVWMAHRNGMSAVKYDIALTVVIVVVSVAASHAGAYLGEQLGAALETTSKVQTLMVFFCQGTLVVLAWGLLYLLWFRNKVGRKALAG